MLPEIGATELLVIAVVALIVVGPKDLPLLLRKLGQMMAKLRGMAAEFRASFDEMARQSELDELRREVAAMREGHFTEQRAALDAAHAEIGQSFNEIEHHLTQDDAMAPEPFVDLAPEPPAAVEAKPAKPRARPADKASAPRAAQPAKPRARKARTEA